MYWVRECFVVVFCFAIINGISGKTISYDDKSTEGCTISIRQDLGEPQPLIIWPGTREFITPGNVTDGTIRLRPKENIELFCTSGFQTPISGNSAIVTCEVNNRFVYDRSEYLFSEFLCTRLPAHTARRTGLPCGGLYSRNTYIAEVGFEVDHRFLHLFDSCHDEETSSNLWVHFYQDPFNHMYQSGYPRIGFIQGSFFPGLAVNNLYTIAQQRRTIAEILGSDELSWQVVPQTGDIFLARGHMAAKTDFAFGIHQQATFYFINTAPQWQSFNAGNWLYIEDGVRRYIADRGINTEIWTGTYGVMEHRDINGNFQKLYLSIDGKGRIPVPKIYYKVVIDVDHAAGIVFIGVNNPHTNVEEIFADYMFCDDVSDNVNYIRWRKDDIRIGYSYACEVNQFAKRVDDLPVLPYVNRLLL